MSTESNTATFVGIDVSSSQLDVCILPSEETFTVPLNDEGVSILRDRLLPLRPERIVFEATGGYEHLAVAILHVSKLPVYVVNPRWVRDFARSMGKLAKTDRVDARVLALYASKMDLTSRPIPDEQQRMLTEMVTRRSQLVEMRTMEANRRHRAKSPKVAHSLEMVIKVLDAQIADLEEQIATLIKETPIWREKDEIFQSVPSVGPVVSMSILAYFPEIGTLNRRQAAALVGVAPFCRDSGAMRGKRTIFGGRPRLRTALYMSTVSAVHCNPPICALNTRLEVQKPKKVARIACVRKLVTILNVMAKNHSLWNPQLALNIT